MQVYCLLRQRRHPAQALPPKSGLLASFLDHPRPAEQAGGWANGFRVWVCTLFCAAWRRVRRLSGQWGQPCCLAKTGASQPASRGVPT